MGLAAAPDFGAWRQSDTARSRLFQLLRQMGEERCHAWVLGIALPASQIGGLAQFEHHRALAGLDHHRHQRAALHGHCRFRSNPIRRDRSLRPQHDKDPRLTQRCLGHLVIDLTGFQRLIPPDIVPGGFQRRRHLPGDAKVLPAVG